MKRLHAAALRSAVILFISLSPAVPLFSDDAGATLYKARCAECHGKSGEGKSRMKAPSLVSSEIKSMSDTELKTIIQQRTNGEMERKSAHTALKRRLTAGQVDALISHLRTMQAR